jgi:hypothetical protein
MPVTGGFDYSHRVEENAVVQDLSEWDGETEGMAEVEAEWLDHARRHDVDASVTLFGPEVSLGQDTQEHLAGEWSANAAEAGIDRIALVSDGIKARAVSANLDVDQEVRAFGSLAAATEWATA